MENKPKTCTSTADGGAPCSLLEGHVGNHFSRFVDSVTARLYSQWASYRRAFRVREIARVYGYDDLLKKLAEEVDDIQTHIAETLREHVAWPFLENKKGMRGYQVGILLGRLGDPRRFPGKVCTVSTEASPHHLPATWPTGSPCPVLQSDGSTCGAEVSPSRVLTEHRDATGVRSVFHQVGLSTDEGGRLLRKKMGQQLRHVPSLQSLLIGPRLGARDEQGNPKSNMSIVGQAIIRQKVQPYRGLYDEVKARVRLERAFAKGESEADAELQEKLFDADGRLNALGLRRADQRDWELERVAAVVAGKRFLGDLFVFWDSQVWDRKSWT